MNGMIAGRIFELSSALQQPGEKPLGIKRKIGEKQRLELCHNVYGLIDSMFHLGEILEYNTELKEGPILTQTTYLIDDSIAYFNCVREGNNIITQGLYTIESKIFEDSFFSDWINRVFKGFSSTETGTFIKNQETKNEMELLTYLFGIKACLSCLRDSGTTGWNVAEKTIGRLIGISNIVHPITEYRSLFFEKAFGKYSVLTTSVFCFNWELVRNYFTKFSEKYGFDLDILRVWMEAGRGLTFSFTEQFKEAYNYMIKNGKKTKGNMFFFYLLWRLFYLKDDNIVKGLFVKNSMKDIYKELLNYSDEFFENLSNDNDVYMFSLCIELYAFYYLAHVISCDLINKDRLLTRGEIGDYKCGMKFFDKTFYEMLDRISPPKKKKDAFGPMVEYYKGKIFNLESNITQETFDNKYEDGVDIQFVPTTTKDGKFRSSILGHPMKMNVFLRDEKNMGSKKKFIEYSKKKKLKNKFGGVLTYLQQVTEDINAQGKGETQDHELSHIYDEEKIIRDRMQKEEAERRRKEDKQTNKKGEKITSDMIFQELKKSIVGQDGILRVISKKVYSYLVLKKTNSKPLSLFFVGPSGSGKSFLSSVLVKALNDLGIFEENETFVAQTELASQYSNEEFLSSLMGAGVGYKGSGERIPFFETLFQSKNQVILFDEVEKGTDGLFKILLSFMNDGSLESIDKQYGIYMGESQFQSNANKVQKLKNVILIFASNSIESKEALEKLVDDTYKDYGTPEEYIENFNHNNKMLYDGLRQYRGAKGRGIDPAFIDRLDSIYLFNELTAEDKKEIVLNMFVKEMKTFDMTKDEIRKVVIKFEKEFLVGGGKGFEELEKYDSMRGFQRFLSDWISKTFEEIVTEEQSD